MSKIIYTSTPSGNNNPIYDLFTKAVDAVSSSAKKMVASADINNTTTEAERFRHSIDGQAVIKSHSKFMAKQMKKPRMRYLKQIITGNKNAN